MSTKKSKKEFNVIEDLRSETIVSAYSAEEALKEYNDSDGWRCHEGFIEIYSLEGVLVVEQEDPNSTDEYEEEEKTVKLCSTCVELLSLDKFDSADDPFRTVKLSCRACVLKNGGV
jgi:hypothetical protein